MYPPVTIPEVPAAEDRQAIYIFEVVAVGMNFVYSYGPTEAQQYIAAVTESEIARDQAKITIQTITQDFFQRNIFSFLPHTYRDWDAKPLEEFGGEGSMADLLQVFALSLDEIKQAIDDFTKLIDIDHCPSRYLRTIAELLNYPLEDVDSTAEQRRQLKSAIEWYRYKGSRQCFEAFLYAFGYYADVIPLWTEDYKVFTETIPGVSLGNDPPNDFPLLQENGGTWYRSPHFGIRLQGIVGDKRTTAIWDDWDQVGYPDLRDDYDALAEEIGQHWAFYQMWDELHDGGVILKNYFSQDNFDYIFRRIEHVRPVFAVLDWLEQQIRMQEMFVMEEEYLLMTANPIKEESGWYLGYCDQDDVLYTRQDERLLGPDYLSLTSPLASGTPPVNDVLGEVAFSVTGAGLGHAEGTLAHSWLYTGAVFYVVIGTVIVPVYDDGEGHLFGDDIEGLIDYLDGSWQLLFFGGSPDNPSDITADYSYSTGIPPCDRSGTMPRGSTELPFPHLRDPQPGICHPPENLEIAVWYELPEQYTLPLTRDGLNLYPPAGPVLFIDHSDFPSRGFDAGAGPDHANTFTREKGYAERPLSLLKVEINPPEGGTWDDQTAGWETISTPWELWGGSAGTTWENATDPWDLQSTPWEGS